MDNKFMAGSAIYFKEITLKFHQIKFKINSKWPVITWNEVGSWRELEVKTNESGNFSELIIRFL